MAFQYDAVKSQRVDLQQSNIGQVGAGEGDDVYVIDAQNFPIGNKTITINDGLADGNNKLVLVGGLEIVSSKVYANALELTLNNGVVVQVLGASTFVFQTGGAVFTGVGGLTQTYAEFVTQSLGTTVPVDNTPATGGAVTVNPAGGTTGGGVIVPGATYALTAGAASADEGTTATFELATTGLAAGTAVAYTLSGIDAADLASGALTGTATVDADGKATISVALAADAVTEGAETLTVTAGGVSASTIVNDTSVEAVYGLTASAASVDEGSSVTFTLALGQPNFTYSYELTGVDATDVVGGALTGSITTDANGNGTFTVTLANDRATDGADTLVATLPNTGLSASVTVNDTSLDNIAPVAVDATADAIEDGAVVTGQLAATDAEGDALTFTLTTAVQGLTINADGSYSFDPTQNDEVKALTNAGGSKDLVATYTVTDGLATATGTLTITAAPAPLSFSIAAGATTVNEGGSITFTVTANDAVAAATDVVFTLVPGNGTAVDQGTATTNLNDFGQGAFNPVTVQIPANGTTATFTITPPNDDITELAESFSVQAVVAGQTLTATATLLDGSTGAGKTFMLTKGLDNIQGTAGNDTIIGSVATGNAELLTLSALDIINGGAGVDTLKVATDGTAVSLANMTAVEIVEIESAAAVSTDVSANADVTNLNVTKAAGAVTVTAGAAADVAVTIKDNTAGVSAHTVDGGKNVNFTLTDAGAGPDTIAIGGTTAAKGDVVVNVTGKAYGATVGNVTLGGVTVTGGQTVSVTQKATSDASKAATDTSAAKVGQGPVIVNANTETTTVTVKQDAAVAAKNAANTTGGVTETATFKFGVLKGGDALTINGLTFTAKAGVDLTAEEVAAAFSNMVSGLANANTDTQGSQVTAKGTFTNAFATGANTAAGYTAAAANGDTVVFTAARANQDATDLTATLTNTSGNSVAPTVTIVQGQAHNATPTGGVMGVDAGVVTVGGGANATAVKTITVDGYAATGSSATGTTSALETLNLSNGGNFAVAQAAATLALNLTNVGTAAKAETLTSAAVVAAPAVLDLNSGATKTLNVQSNGTNTVDLQLDGAGTTTLNVSGTGLLNSGSGTNTAASLTTIKVTETAGLTLNSQATTNVTSVDTTGTTGAVTLTLVGSKAVYTGGAGVDKVTISNANTAIAKAVDLGAGDDTLTLNVTAGSVAVPTVDLKGGDGTDTIALSAADAVALSANGTFAGKIDGFEKLSIGNATATGTVNLANLDNINYVVSANSTAVASAAVDENGLVAFQTLTAGQSVTVAGRTVTVSAGASASATEVAAAFLSGNPTTTIGSTTLTVSGALASWTAAANSTGVLKFTSTTPATNVGTDLTATDAGLAAPTAVAAGTKTDGGLAAQESTAWTMNGLTNGQFYTISGVTVTANKTLTATEVATAFATGTLAGSYTVANAFVNPTGWTGATFSHNGAGVLTLTNGAVGDVADFTTAPVANGVGASPTDAVVSDYVQGAAAGVSTSVGLTIDKMASGGTLELTAAGAGAIVKVTDAAKGTADVLNVVTNANGIVGTVTAADVETINLNIKDALSTIATQAWTDANGNFVKTENVSATTLAVAGNTATKAITVEGAGNLTLDVAANTKLATVDAGNATGALTLNLSAHNGDAITVTGGKGNDELTASQGTNAKADVLVGGEGHDTLYAGSNGAKLTGGAGNDLFVLTAGTKEVNTYTSIQDFQAGDVLALNVVAGTNVTAFNKLTAVLNENTSVFSNFVDAAIQQATVAGQSVWFQFKGNAYVVVDNVETGGASADVFQNGQDAVIELVGIDLNNASFNSTHATVALI